MWREPRRAWPHHGLGDERGDIVGADLANGEFEVVGAEKIARGTGAIGAAAIRVARRDVFGWWQDRRERPASRGVSSEPERGDRCAVERRAPPDHEVAGAIPAFAVVLDRHFHRVVGRLRRRRTNQTLPNPSGANSSMMMRAQLSTASVVKACVGA